MQPQGQESPPEKEDMVVYRRIIANAFLLSETEIHEAGFRSPEWATRGMNPDAPASMLSNILRRINAASGFELNEAEEDVIVEIARRVFGGDHGDERFAEVKRLSESTLASENGNNKAMKLWLRMTHEYSLAIGQFLGEARDLAVLFEVLSKKGYWNPSKMWAKLSGCIISSKGEIISYNTLVSAASKYRRGEFQTTMSEFLEQMPSRPKPASPKRRAKPATSRKRGDSR